MGSDYLASPLIFLVSIAAGFYVLIIMLRFLLQLLHADFFNPVSRLVVSLTTPVLNPLRRLIPGYGGIDIASLVLAWFVKSVELAIVLALSGFQGSVLSAFAWSIPALIVLTLYIFIFSIFIDAILSWFPSTYNHPLRTVAGAIGAPVLGFTRRILPTSTSGFDLAPMVATIGLILVKMLLMPPLYALFGVPIGLF